MMTIAITIPRPQPPTTQITRIHHGKLVLAGSTSAGSVVAGTVGHVIEVGLSGEEAVVCRQGVVRLFGGHAVQFTVHDVLEAAAIYIVAQQRVNDRVTVLDEPGVGIRIDAQSGQRGNDLRNGFAGGNLRRAVATALSMASCTFRSFV